MNKIQKEKFLDNLRDLFKYLKKKLKLKTTPKLFLNIDEKNSKKILGRTGYYNPNDNSIHLFILNRHPKDILRSFAHEIVHHWQHEHKQLEKKSSKGEEHDPQYAQNDMWMRQMEKQAYLLGNMLFRDWEDGKKTNDSNKNTPDFTKENTLIIGTEYPSQKFNYNDINEGIDDIMDKIGSALLISGIVGLMWLAHRQDDMRPGKQLIQGRPVQVTMSYEDIGGHKGRRIRNAFDKYFKNQLFQLKIDSSIKNDIDVDYDEKTIRVKNADVIKRYDAFQDLLADELVRKMTVSKVPESLPETA